MLSLPWKASPVIDIVALRVNVMTAMDLEETLPRRKDDLVAELAKQDLDPYSVAELDDRIERLQAEIERTRAKREKAVHHRASADALFKR